MNFFLPDLESSRKVVQAFKDKGVDVCWNYYDNNWHYIKKWDHLKTQKSLYPLSTEIKAALSDLQNASFEQSDHFIGRNISCLIKLSWTEEEVKQRASVMVEAIKSSF